LVPAEGLRLEVEAAPAGEDKPRRLAVVIRRAAIVSVAALHRFISGQRDEEEYAYHALQCLDIVLKHRMAMADRSLPVARGVFFRGPGTRSLGGGAEVWLGYQQSLRPCQTGLALNVDMAATAVLEEKPLLELVADKVGHVAGPLPDAARRRLNRDLRGVKVVTSHTGMTKAIRHLSRGSPFQETFEREGRQVSVADYLEAQYGVRLTNRDMPCVAVGNGTVLLPMELCRVAPRQRLMRLDEAQTSEIIKIAAQRPGDRLAAIDHAVNRQAAFPDDPTARAFGLSISSRTVEVGARVLPNPMLAYGSPGRYDPKGGGSWNLRDVRFLNGSSLPSWAVVCFANQRFAAEDLEAARGQHGPTFMAEFVDMLNKCGVTTPREFPPVVYPDRNATVYSAVTEAKARAQAAFGAPAALVLVVLPDTGAALYREVKQASDSMLGLPTQCIVSRKAGIGCPARGRPQYCANVAMKVNAKLGGCNTRLGDVERLPVLGARRPFMILGADVTHPRPGEGGPSIAAVVGSMDATATRYAARVTMQRGGQEIVAELKAMVKSLLLEFYGATRGMRPESLLFYRDGVSESQFQEVYYKEYSALLEACAEMGDAGAEYRPPITFVIVQKRHHTRFFPKSTDQSNRDRSGNVLPGTVVDNDIAHPHDFSFYLNSHSGIQGTSKPAHYSVLVDENKFGADGMQLLTYHLCYLFCRCTRSISVCPPAQYAHLAAFRGRLMLRGEGGSDTASSASGGGGGTVEFMSINPRLQKAMFYV
ncbi:hypothetical protein APUTEX25_005203, partial [Auxenochlorella protothecoides]